MTIDDAKVCLSIQVEVKHRLGKAYEAHAIQLGLEALRRLEQAREQPYAYNNAALVGETSS